ncbi:acyl-coenzyme A synthetase/AMP-(fatty) acid ligase [Duganella sp. 1411]|uniref:AMP-binding protein n=1 Tax=Duganella sp. 1411 TaxID=2806572 RepID=UPI001AE2B95F|nr:AMP-binding protein [Duganella sp. 1411]MBP1204091.1 acyl-coenzyme A synthetase/AMP-(fatty) acid ligase [Duganella sp. 1411]
MSDRIERLYAAMAARPAGGIVGWSAGEGVTNERFLARARAWHALLRGRPGRDYALYLEDSIEFGAALLGAWHAGKTIWLSADTLETTCAALRASVDGFLGQFPAEMAPLQPSPPADDDAEIDGTLDPEFPALVVFTSGSTGAAQAIPKKLSQMANEVETLDLLFGPATGDAAILATVSHQHIYGLLFKILWPLSSGRAIHAISIAFPEALAPAMAAGPCVLIASPAHLKRLPDHLDWSGAARMLRGVFSSGGPLAPETAFAMGTVLGKVPVEVYGSSETGGVAWRQRKAGADDSWLPFPTVQWRLGEDNGLEVRSPHLPDDAWLALADRAEGAGRAPSGGEQRFVLRGRSDRIVKIEEKRVSLTAMEAALTGTGLAAEARVVLCDPVAGERQKVAAFVVPTIAGRTLLATGGKTALNARLRAALAATVELVALPRRWRYLDQMPVNAQGKTTLAALLALLDDDGVDRRPRLPQVRELERAGDRVLLEVTAPSNLYYFDGHFDVAPILPGVVQVDWAIHYGRQYFPLPAIFKGINALKFQQVIQPAQPVRLELTHDAVKGSLQFRYASDAGQHSSGRVMLLAGSGHD